MPFNYYLYLCCQLSCCLITGSVLVIIFSSCYVYRAMDHRDGSGDSFLYIIPLHSYEFQRIPLDDERVAFDYVIIANFANNSE